MQQVFDRHSDPATELILASALGPALRDLDVAVDEEDVDQIFKAADLNKNGGLDFHEFWTLVGMPSPIEEWVRSLPLAQLVADAMPRIDGKREDQVRHLSSITESQLEESFAVLMDGLKRMLRESLAALKVSYATWDRATTADNGAALKFQISTMSVGNISNFHEGLAARIGEFQDSSLGIVVLHPRYVFNTIHVVSAAFLTFILRQGSLTWISRKPWRQSTAAKAGISNTSSPGTTISGPAPRTSG